MSELRAVGFDLDGTLFDHRGSAQSGARRFLRALGIAPTPAVLTSWFSAEDEQFERWRSGLISFQEQRRERLRTVLPLFDVALPAEDADLDALFDEYLHAYRESWTIFPDSRDILRDLRTSGYRVGLLTNGTQAQQVEKLQRTGLAEAFDVVCTSERIGVQKPDPRAFRVLAAELGVDPSECLFVGDNPAHDVEGARAAGMRGVLADRHGRHAAGIQDLIDDALAA